MTDSKRNQAHATAKTWRVEIWGQDDGERGCRAAFTSTSALWPFIFTAIAKAEFMRAHRGRMERIG